MVRAIFLCAALLSTAFPGWAINKCIGADGKPVFQDAPCSVGSKAETLGSTAAPTRPKPQNVMSIGDVAKDLDAQLESKEVRKKIETNMQVRKANEQAMARALSREPQPCGDGVFSERPAIGMTESAFLQCTQFSKDWDYVKVNETETSGGIHRQYVYRAHAPIHYVYVERGRVTAISK